MELFIDFFTQFVENLVDQDLFKIVLFLIIFFFILLADRNTRDQSFKLVLGFFLFLSMLAEGVFIYQRFLS